MKTITAIVVFPVAVEISVNDDFGLPDNETLADILKEEAGNVFEVSSIRPTIHECSMPELVD